jgi:2-amino-4-hydroxy-6-hydroxymethyldihydropteridine diphosphokinase
MLGNPQETLLSAIGSLVNESCHFCAISRFFASPAYPPGAGPDFVNAALMLRTTLSPEALLSHLHEVEARFGRQRQDRWGARTVDLDLLFMGDLVLPDAATVQAWIDLPDARQRREAPDRLILPHPRLQDRAFVLIPLAEIAPAWCHPLTGRSVIAMENGLSAAQKAGIHPL